MSLKGVNAQSRVAQEEGPGTKGKAFMKTRWHLFSQWASQLPPHNPYAVQPGERPPDGLL